MIQRELQKHQWKAFKRHPMFERNMALKVFMFIMFGFLGLQLMSFGFLLNEILLEHGPYGQAIDSFNYYILYFLLGDFMVKYMAKKSQSMQIVPYLTFPVKRNRMFNFLLTKEFSNIWNLYFLFLLLPFVFKSITPYYGFLSTIFYLLFFYLLCIGNSLLVNIANNLLNRNGWFLLLPLVIVAGIWGITLLPGVETGDYTVKTGEWILQLNPVAWGVLLLILALLWRVNLRMLRGEVYRAMQGKKISEGGTFSHLPFVDKMGTIGSFIELEVKMILRSKRLKQQMYAGVFFIVFYFGMHDSPGLNEIFFNQLLFTMFVIGWVGLIMSQYMFTAESSFFDGLMTRNFSLFDMMKGKYLFYVSYSVLMCVLMLALAFWRKQDFVFLTSVFFYTIGFLFFLMFQNAVYNKSYFNHAESGMFNWKGTSGNMLMVTMIAMFLPIILVIIISGIFSRPVANYFMLITGLLFTLTSNIWLKWTYNRFLKRKYKNMEGFRSNE